MYLQHPRGDYSSTQGAFAENSCPRGAHMNTVLCAHVASYVYMKIIPGAASLGAL